MFFWTQSKKVDSEIISQLLITDPRLRNSQVRSLRVLSSKIERSDTNSDLVNQ